MKGQFSDLLKIFNFFTSKFNWEPIKEDENIIGLKKWKNDYSRTRKSNRIIWQSII